MLIILCLPLLTSLSFSLQAAVICGCIGIVAEVSGEALMKRHKQGWVNEVIDNLDDLVKRVREAKNNNEVDCNCHLISSDYNLQRVAVISRQ